MWFLPQNKVENKGKASIVTLVSTVIILNPVRPFESIVTKHFEFPFFLSEIWLIKNHFIFRTTKQHYIWYAVQTEYAFWAWTETTETDTPIGPPFLCQIHMKYMIFFFLPTVAAESTTTAHTAPKLAYYFYLTVTKL